MNHIPQEKSANNDCILFIVPIKARSTTKQWDFTCYLLEKTLFSILRQTDSRFAVVVVGHDRPDLPYSIASNICFLEANYPSLGLGSSRQERDVDKVCKQLIGLRLLLNENFSHYMFIDADDTISRNTTVLAFSENPQAVKIMKKGYVFDEKTKQFWLVDRFSSLCGTCAIFPVDKKFVDRISSNDLVSEIRKDRSTIHKNGLYSLMSHTNWANAAEQAGLRVSQVRVPHVVYRWNYGDQTNHPNVFRLSLSKHIRRHLPPVFSRGKRWQPVQVDSSMRQEFGIF